MQYRLWWGEGSYHDNMKLAQQIALQQKQLSEEEIRNQALRKDIENLKKGNEALEELAREQLGLIKQGEYFFRVIRPAKK
ncbi:MAG TPA: cell division protein FtsB [Aeromonadales bacterium]|nr:cell division protein FtsB [Aeromonadales bacterium]